LTNKLISLDKELQDNEKIIAWYKTNAELLNTKQQLGVDQETLQKVKQEKQPVIDALLLHENAELFKELLDQIIRNERDIIKNKEKLTGLDAELQLVEREHAKAEYSEKACKELHQAKEKEHRLWLPKLDKVAKMDADILNAKQAKAKMDAEKKVLLTQIKNYQDNIVLKEKECKVQEIAIKNKEVFLLENKNILEIEKQLADWNAKLILRKSYREQIDNYFFIKNKREKERDKAVHELASLEKVFIQENKTLEKIKNEVFEISALQESSNLEKLLVQQKKLNNKLTAWKNALSLSKNFSSSIIRKKELDDQKKDYDAKIIGFIENLEHLKLKIIEAEKSLKDAEEILNLKSTIQSFEEERKKLIKGEPCNLCGSREHPFVESYESIDLLKSETEVSKRKIVLQNHKNEEKKNEIGLAQINAQLESNNLQTKNINEICNEMLNAFLALQVDCDIDDLQSINRSIGANEDELGIVLKQIDEVQLIQKRKDEKNKQLNLEQEKISTLKNKIASLQEKSKNLNQQLKDEQESFNELNKKNQEIELFIKTVFSKYKLQLPEIDNTAKFITDLETKILQFQNESKKLIEIKNIVSQLSNDLKNIQSILIEKSNEQLEIDREIDEVNEKLIFFTDSRKALLPLEISIENKRKELQNAIDFTQKEFEIASRNLNVLKTSKATKEKEKENIINEGLTLKSGLEKLHTEFNLKIGKSSFNSRSEVEKALLNFEQKTSYLKIRKRIDERTIELNALSEKLINDFEKQNKKKNFAITEEYAQKQRNENRENREALIKRGGEIQKQFELDNQIIERNRGVFDEIKKQEKVLKKWMDLLSLIGGSKHAFNTYVQRLTLQNLIQLANIHLFKLNMRYSLQMNESYKPGEELNFMLIDHYQTDEARLVDTSSGGEKFLISLALALGLSDLASNNVKIGSLFIDEGFGTLDNNTLETVISTLETLQKQGKMIGIISHVENLKERISTQISILKKSNGVSMVEII